MHCAQASAFGTYVIWLLVLVQCDVLANQDADADTRQVEAVQKLHACADTLIVTFRWLSCSATRNLTSRVLLLVTACHHAATLNVLCACCKCLGHLMDLR
jgi:hypothetical protein